jgi:hypothetical protein
LLVLFAAAEVPARVACRHVILGSNFLVGSVNDSALQTLQQLHTLDLSNNQLQGPLPASSFALPSLQYVTPPGMCVVTAHDATLMASQFPQRQHEPV